MIRTFPARIIASQGTRNDADLPNIENYCDISALLSGQRHVFCKGSPAKNYLEDVREPYL